MRQINNPQIRVYQNRFTKRHKKAKCEIPDEIDTTDFSPQTGKSRQRLFQGI